MEDDFFNSVFVPVPGGTLGSQTLWVRVAADAT
jgi:hypothetical protein